MAPKQTRKQQLAKEIADEDAEPSVSNEVDPKQVDPDAELMRGSPGDPITEPISDPTLVADPIPAADPDVEVQIGGRLVTIPQSTADLIETERASYAKEPTPAAAPTPVEQSDEASFNQDKFFADPDGYMADFRDSIKKELKSEVRAEYQADQSKRSFWVDFDSANDDLTGEHTFVTGVMQDNWDLLKDLKTVAAVSKLGDLTRIKILKLSGQKPVERSIRPGEDLESSTGDPLIPLTNRNDNIPTSLTGAIKARQATRTGT